ncbi:MAG: class I tRNA ligase family protein, partial [Anaerolineaceae bacterium]|nr:class I tRNA ligase family protein [Anaerolineaceae bacterium]
EKMERVELKNALAEVMGLATEVNKYLDVHAPWFEIKTDRAQAEKSLFTAIQAIDWLKIMFAPFLPFTSETLNTILDYPQPLFGKARQMEARDELGSHTVLTYDEAGALSGSGEDVWQPVPLQAGRPFNQPVPLIKKLDHAIVEMERARLGQA